MPNVSLSTRALVVALKAPLGGAQTSAQVSVATGIPVRTVNKIYMRARKRGFMPYARPLALADEFLADAPRSGRPPTRKKDEEVEGGRKKRKKMGRPKKVVSKKAPVTAAVPVDASNQGQADAAMPDYVPRPVDAPSLDQGDPGFSHAPGPAHPPGLDQGGPGPDQGGLRPAHAPGPTGNEGAQRPAHPPGPQEGEQRPAHACTSTLGPTPAPGPAPAAGPAHTLGPAHAPGPAYAPGPVYVPGAVPVPAPVPVPVQGPAPSAALPTSRPLRALAPRPPPAPPAPPSSSKGKGVKRTKKQPVMKGWSFTWKD